MLNKVDVRTGKHPTSMNRDTVDDQMEAQHGGGALVRNCYGVARNPNQVSQKEIFPFRVKHMLSTVLSSKASVAI